MKKIKQAILFLVLIQTHSFAQVNLVPNYSFEDTIHCPIGPGYLNYARSWTQIGTSDYYNICANGPVGVPSNGAGYQYARTGNAYAGFYTWGAGIDIRECIYAKLDSTLTPLHKYCVEFYVSLGDIGNVACNNIGVFFSDTAITPTSVNDLFLLLPQVSNNPITNPLTDKIGWTKVSGNFIAAGGENYITIGNFINNANSDTTLVNTGGLYAPYYYIDDVSVIDCTYDGVEELSEATINIIPNPATNQFTIENSQLRMNSIHIYNVLGEEVQSLKLESSKLAVDISSLANGVYFVEVETEKGIVRKRLVKEK
ncbi:MAG: T9SS type A sorting domain-containing protein [Bacteroidota bacterium]